MIIKNGVKAGYEKAIRDARALGIFSEEQLSSYGEDISYLLGINVVSTKNGKRAKQKYGKHETYGCDDTTEASLRL